MVRTSSAVAISYLALQWRDGAILLHTVVVVGLMYLRPSSRLVIAPVTACSGPFSADKEASEPANSRTNLPSSLPACQPDRQNGLDWWPPAEGGAVPVTTAKLRNLGGGVGVEQFWCCISISLVGSSGDLVCSAIPVWETPTVLYASRYESNGHDLPDRQQYVSRDTSPSTPQLAPVVRPHSPNQHRCKTQA